MKILTFDLDLLGCLVGFNSFYSVGLISLRSIRFNSWVASLGCLVGLPRWVNGEKSQNVTNITKCYKNIKMILRLFKALF